jgi:mannose-1-phosphate guanylyltransferase
MGEIVSNAHVVIMAGGAGTRFWPLSRGARPKQLLSFDACESLLQATYRRVQSLVPPDHVWVVTSEQLAGDVAAQLPHVPAAQILAEPIGRNTAPCIGWAAAHIRRIDPYAAMVVLPADHHIGREDEYVLTLRNGIRACADGEFVTVGIVPTRPETGYGYIEEGDPIADAPHTHTPPRRVARFVEKPSLEKAQEFLERRNFLWNSGVFFFTVQSILQAIRTHLPALFEHLEAYDHAAAQGRETSLVQQTYASLPNISIDYGIMEKVDHTLVIRGDFGWSDLGSWTTAWELASKDAQGNVAPDDAILIESRDCYVQSEASRAVAIVGVHDLVVVDTPDALLIVPRDRAQDVKLVVEALRKAGRTELL